MVNNIANKVKKDGSYSPLMFYTRLVLTDENHLRLYLQYT